jgi:hypothetical protein
MEKDKKSIKNALGDISREILDIENEKNLGKIVKQYSKINTDIKNAGARIYTLRQVFENDDISLNKNEINEEQYQTYTKELSEEEINKIIGCEDLELQIEDYKKLLKKLNSCKEYLNSKKINIVECDKNIDKDDKDIKENQKKNQKFKSKPKPKNSINSINSKKKNLSSSSSESESINSDSSTSSSD